MALSAERILARRGNEPTRNEFAYPVAAGVKVYRGAMCAVNASGQIVLPSSTSAVAILGIANVTVDNSAGSGASTALVTAQKGTFPLVVGGATAANIPAPVYATDDATLSLSNTESAVYARGGSDTGTGTCGAITVSGGAKVGVYTGTVLSGAATFSLTDPNGDALATGALGTAYSSGGLAFTVSNSGTSFIATDTFTITVSEAGNALRAGELVGIENSLTYVSIANS